MSENTTLDPRISIGSTQKTALSAFWSLLSPA